MIKNKLFISSFEACTENGFLAKSIADILVSKEDCIIRNLPDFTALNEYDILLSPLKSEKSNNIDTIIQFVPSDYIEYHFNYKNIVIPNVNHFIKRNKSILDKLSLADELWVFDDQQKEFLSDKLADKTVVVGYPYSKNRVANLFETKTKNSNHLIKFYCITDISNLENLEILIYNFILVFHKINNINLYIYLKQFDNKDHSEIIKNLLDKIRKQFTMIEPSVLDRIITILTGNYYVDKEVYLDLHSDSDCYINIDYYTNPDLLTSSFLGKFILSIINVKGVVEYNDDFVIETTPSNYRTFYGNRNYINEFNSYPKINDISLQNGLIKIYNTLKTKNHSNICYKKLNGDGLYK